MAESGSRLLVDCAVSESGLASAIAYCDSLASRFLHLHTDLASNLHQISFLLSFEGAYIGIERLDEVWCIYFKNLIKCQGTFYEGVFRRQWCPITLGVALDETRLMRRRRHSRSETVF